jgi:hypothetical protein
MNGNYDIISALLYRFVIFTLTVLVVISVPLLFFINTSGAIDQQLLQKATAKGVTNSSSSSNTTDHTAGQNVESLVRSILSPVPLSSSAVNESRWNRTNGSSAGIGHSEDTIAEKNTANPVSRTEASTIPTKTTIIETTKNGNTTTNSSTTPLQPSLSSLRSTVNQPKSSTIKQGNDIQNTSVRNVHTLLLSHQIIPPKNFILLYGTSSYKIFNGHLDAKIPCDANSAPSLQILVGHSPYLKPVQLHLVKEFSKPGNICMYDVDIGSETAATTHGNGSIDKGGGSPPLPQQGDTLTNTVLVLSNPTDSTVTLPNTSTVIIGVNEIGSS